MAKQEQTNSAELVVTLRREIAELEMICQVWMSASDIKDQRISELEHQVRQLQQRVSRLSHRARRREQPTGELIRIKTR